jgi:hypothetical protein
LINYRIKVYEYVLRMKEEFQRKITNQEEDICQDVTRGKERCQTEGEADRRKKTNTFETETGLLIVPYD